MTVLFAIWRVSRRTASLLDEALAGAGMTASEFAVHSLLRVSGPLSVTEVAARSGAPLTTVSQQLKRLERRGHLSRAPHPDDARVVLLSLSSDGVEAHERAAPAFRDLLERVEDALGSDLEQVDYSLGRLNAVLAGIAGEDRPVEEARPDTARAHGVAYTGDALDDRQEAEVRRYIDWVRTRDG